MPDKTGETTMCPRCGSAVIADEGEEDCGGLCGECLGDDLYQAMEGLYGQGVWPV